MSNTMDFGSYITEPDPEAPPRLPLSAIAELVQGRPGATEPDSYVNADAIERRVLYVYLTAEERKGLGRPLSLLKPPR